MRISPSAMLELRQMTPEQLRYLGSSQLVYLKVGIHAGEQEFVIYSADGSPIEAVDDIEDAWDSIAERGLGLVTVH